MSRLLRWRSTPLVSHGRGRAGPILACLGAAALGCGGEGGLTRDGKALTPAGSAGSEASVTTPAAPDDNGRIDANGELLLDDLNDADDTFLSAGIAGEWFTYSDGTSAVTPPDHTGLGAMGGEAHVSGSGFSDWGVGVSAYFEAADLAPFRSLVLRVRGSGTLVVEVVTPATSPAEEGGTCINPGCYGHFAAAIELSAEYQDFELAFEELTQPSWAQPAELALGRVISINLVAKTVAGTAAIDVWLDRLSLLAGGT